MDPPQAATTVRMSWNPEQQRLLHALGHDLMVHRVGADFAGAAFVGAAFVGADFVGAASAAMPLTESIAAKAAPTVMGNKLVEAIRRAAGGSDVSTLIDDIGRLRNEPALKRALWPRLRALRRSH